MEALKNLVGKASTNKNEGGRGLASGTHHDSDSTSTSESTTRHADSNEGSRGLATEAYQTESSAPSTTTATTSSTGNVASGVSGAGGETYETSETRMAPAVQRETVTKMQEDRTQTLVDKETHVDHFHTTLQPVTDRQVEPTVHLQQQAETQHREFEHDDAAKTKAALEAQAAQFQSTRTDGGVTETMTTLPTQESSSTHHHIHETIQPVIQKETIQPTVVETVVPVHEVHHGASHIHDTTVAPAMSMEEFTKSQSAQGSAAETRKDD